MLAHLKRAQMRKLFSFTGNKKRKWGCEIIASAHIVDLTEWGGAGVGNWAHYPPTKTHDEQPTAQVPTHHYKTCAIQFLSFKLI